MALDIWTMDNFHFTVTFVSFKFQSDKASMLDDAIEYLKSLQLQVQVYLSL